MIYLLTYRIKMFNGNLLLLVGLLFFVSSCTEVVFVELDGSDAEIVVQASVPESGFAEVKISKSVHFNTSNEFPAVTGAVVIFQNDSGLIETLTEYKPGYYRSSVIKGVPETTYRLTIETAGKVFQSEDRMPKPVRMESVKVRKFVFPVEGMPDDLLSSPLMEVVVDFTDPLEDENYYRIIEYKNGKSVKSHLSDDKFNNGKPVRSFLLSLNRTLISGDSLTIEMQSISKPVYNYLFGFSDMNNIPQGTTPSNPLGNITGVKLGYFSAHTVHRVTLVIP
ncbi:MAG: DUF4249 domain-containing protein [Paludibacter sp.]|nr:DUF4249 domain-containing protein [Paludibacter sp.]